MKPMKEFKAFILRGNVVDLAVGVIMGAAFSSVVSSLVKNILTPLTGIFGGSLGVSPDARSSVGQATLFYGLFINDVIAFLLMAVTVFFFVVKPINKLMSLTRTEPPVEETTRPCPHCISSIPVKATVCMFCTREVGAPA